MILTINRNKLNFILSFPTFVFMHFKAQIKYFFCATENDIQIERDAIMELDVENSKSSKMVKEI